MVLSNLTFGVLAYVQKLEADSSRVIAEANAAEASRQRILYEQAKAEAEAQRALAIANEKIAMEATQTAKEKK